jgi:hypothetical protein
MSKSRIFISHSARGDDGVAMLLIQDLINALGGDFAVLIDQENLRLGDHWRSTINTWILTCDAAVILLSEKALLSDYVFFEASVLSVRSREASFRLIPVLVDGLTFEKVQESRFAPIVLNEIQGARLSEEEGKDAAKRLAVVENVCAALAAVQHSETTADKRIKTLCQLLEKVRSAELNDAGRVLGLELEGLLSPTACRLEMAARMMELGISQTVNTALRRMRKHLSESDALEIIRVLATSWVDLRTAERIRQIGKSTIEPRVTGTNAQKSLIAKTYVWSACEDASRWSWAVGEIHGPLVENGPLSIEEQIKTSLNSILAVDDETLLAATLDALETSAEEPEPVFVALPAQGLNERSIERLRTAFPTVTFFILAGQDRGDHQVLAKAKVTLLEPPLEPNFEENFCKTYDLTWNFLKERSSAKNILAHASSY